MSKKEAHDIDFVALSAFQMTEKNMCICVVVYQSW